MASSVERCALITGASGGIGRATAIAFAQAGINVILMGRSQERLAKVVAEVEQLGAKATAYTCDFANLDPIKETVGNIIQTHAPVDILVNNAGVGYTGDLASLPLADWQKVLDLNVTSVLLCIQAVLPSMRDRQHGRIVNVASIAGYQAFPGWGAYNVSKAGLIALSKTLAAEERSNGISVTIICPGAVNTPIWDTKTVSVDFDRSKMLTPDIVAQMILQSVLVPAQAVVEELTIVPSAGAL